MAAFFVDIEKRKSIGVISAISAISVIILITPDTTLYHRAISINNATKKITKLTIRHTHRLDSTSSAK